MSDNVNIDVNFILGDKSGIDAAKDAESIIGKVRKSLKVVEARGGISAIVGRGRDVDKLNESLNDTGKELKDAAAQALSLSENLGKASTQEISMGGGGDVVGRADTALSAVAGTLGAVGGTGASEFVALQSDIFGTIDALKDLGPELLHAGGAVGKLATSGAAVAGIIPGISAGTGALVATLGPLAALVGIGAVAFGKLQESISNTSSVINTALVASQKYYDLVGEGTTQDVQEAIKAEEVRLSSLKKQRAEVQQVREGLEGEFGVLAGAVAAIYGGDLNARAAELDDQISESESALGRFTSGLSSAEVAANDAAIALTEANNALITSAREGAELEKQRAQIIRTASRDTLEASKLSSKEAIDAYENQLAALEKIADKTPEVEEEIKAVNVAREKEIANLEFLTGAVDAAVAGRERLASAEEQREKRQEDLVAENEALAKSAEDAAKKTEKANADLKRAIDKRDSIELRNAQALTDIAQKAGERRVDAARAYADKLADITRKSQDNILKATRDAAYKRSDIIRDANRDAQTATRKTIDDERTAGLEAQRANADAILKLEQDTARRRRQQMENEDDLISSRDFAGLARLRKQGKLQDRETKIAAGEDAATRKRSAERTIEDLKRSAAIEQRERQIQTQQRIADLRTEFDRARQERQIQIEQERRDAQITNERKLRDLQIANERELQARQIGFQREMELVNVAAQQRVAIMAQTENVITQVTARMGQSFNMLRGLFGGGGTTNNSSASFNQTFNVNGGDPRQIQAAAGRAVDQRLNQVFGRH